MTPRGNLENRPGHVVGGHGAQPDAGREGGGDDEGDLVGAQAERARDHQRQDLASGRVGHVDVERKPEALAHHGHDLHAEMEQRPDHHADGQALDAQGGPEQQRAADDGDVVERRRGGCGGETAARVEHGRGHRTDRQQRRRDEHDACQAHGQLRPHGVETGRQQGHDLRREDGHDRGRQHKREQHQVEHGRHDSPGALLLVTREQAGQDRDHRRGQRTRGDQLEDGVGQAERGEIGVQLHPGAEFVGDDHQAYPAEHTRQEERAGHDQPGACQRACSRINGVGQCPRLSGLSGSSRRPFSGWSAGALAGTRSVAAPE